jgi:geranylgeranyl diphosphate synthase type II
MNAKSRIERALQAAVARGEAPGAPPRLAAAVRYALFPGGARIRPRLCLSVAAACGDDDPDATDGAAAAIELLHCASLVHDDLPCFDDAATRRGKPSVHKAFGEPLAVLAGDALIVAAFQALACGAAASPGRLGALVAVVGGAAGMPLGIVAGQAWECEPELDLASYQRAKTGALFTAAAAAGAAAAGAEPQSWRTMGERLGEAYQVADDIRDAVADEAEMGKPAGRDAALGRPSAALRLGVAGAVAYLESLAADAVRAIPPCAGAAELRALILGEMQRLMPRAAAQHAA